MSIDLITECSLLSDSLCGVLVKTTCTTDPSSCGVYVDFFSYDILVQLIEFSVPVLLLAFAFRMGRKMFYSGV